MVEKNRFVLHILPNFILRHKPGLVLHKTSTMQQPPPYPGEAYSYNMVPKAPPIGQMPPPMLKLPVERECPICHKQVGS